MNSLPGLLIVAVIVLVLPGDLSEETSDAAACGH
jgi:hypothetical protein